MKFLEYKFKSGIVASAFKSTIVLFCAFFLWLTFFFMGRSAFFPRMNAFFFFFQNMPSLSEEEQITVGDEWVH